MDVEAIAKRIAIDHGVNVLEKDVIETLEKLKAANKDKTTGAGQAPVTAQTPEVSPITSASAPPAPLPAGTGAASAPLQTVPAPLQTVPAPLQTVPAPLQAVPAPLQTSSEQPKTGSEQPSNLKIPADVKPLPIALIDDLIMQNYSREGIEAILKENKLPPYRNLISERMKLVKPAVRGASNTQPLMGTGAAPLSTGAESVNSPATDTQNVSSIKTSENTGNSGISSENVVAPLPAPQETVPAPLSTGAAPLPTGAGATPAPQPIGSGASSAPLPADLPSMLAAFQQFLAAYKQAPNSVPAGSE